MNLSTRQLAAFLLVARLGSFTKAAEQMHMTQAGLSATIRELEHQFSCRLFDRTTRSVRLTSEGRALLPFAERIRNDLGAATQAVKATAAASRSLLTVAATPIAATTLIARAGLDFGRRVPGVELRIRDVPQAEVQRLVETGEADIGFTIFPKPASDIDLQSLLSFRLVCIAPKGTLSARASRRGPEIRWRDLPPRTLITLPATLLIQQVIDQHLMDHARFAGQRTTYNSMHTILAMVAGSPGMTMPAVDGAAVDKRLKEGRAHKTINLSLGSIRHILNVAARKWRVDICGGRTAPVLEQVPLLTMLQLEGHQREPQPITWEDQRVLLSLVPLHLARMALFILNTGVRDDVVCNLQWDWEIRLKLDEIEVSVFEVPREHVKGRNKAFDYVVCNSVAQRIVDEMRGRHDEYVFVWRRERTSQKKLKRHESTPPMPYRPIEAMNNNGWQRARSKARLGDLHVHDLRHTVGMRLREAGVAKETRSIILWHKDASMTARYSAAQVLEVRSALELIKEETGRENRSLRSLAKEARRTRVPSVSLRQEKTA